ncbi:MAG: nucleotide sugar dehydrogenase [Candidatus Omnitrophota bacterium]|nr:nucleotide sugar dehydrogenase [Candidatus Omnitrophota bacterium]
MKTKGFLSVFGLGYVGAVTAACLADRGYRVIGVDAKKKKVSLINAGKSPIIEKGLDEIISRTVKKKMFFATTSYEYAVRNSSVSMLCIGTPSLQSGAIDLTYLENVSRQIGRVLGSLNRYHLIIVRSTMLPGTTEKIIIPLLEQSSSRKAFRDFGVLVNPEFMREGNSIEDFYAPAKVIIGGCNKRDLMAAKALYRFIKAPLVVTDIKTAEFTKYIDNMFHALKISFANEIGVLADKFGLDRSRAMEIFCMDKKSNISSRYLRPGFAFGGSCLPKDIKAILHKVRVEDLDAPLLEAILKSNDTHIYRALEKILRTGKKNIGMLGLSFKPGTDDLRESQMVKLAELLIGKGAKLKIYDKNVSLASITGANKLYIKKEIPHISSLLCSSINRVLNDSDVIVIGHSTKEFGEAVKKAKKGKIIIDLST